MNHQITGLDPEFDAWAIRRLEVDLGRQQIAWERHFRNRAIAPIIVEYEDLAHCRRKQLARILAFIGQDPSAANIIPEARLLRQADSRTVAWRRQLDAEDSRSGAGMSGYSSDDLESQ
jgi:LPS sulfotransferase NodH